MVPLGHMPMQEGVMRFALVWRGQKLPISDETGWQSVEFPSRENLCLFQQPRAVCNFDSYLFTGSWRTTHCCHVKYIGVTTWANVQWLWVRVPTR
jgi:hypothetical protein